MDKNHQDKTDSNSIATEEKLWIPPLSPNEQKKLTQLQQKNVKRLPLKWTGFAGKTLWDWMQLLAALAIPIAIALGTAWFSYQQNQTSLQVSERQHQTDLQIAATRYATDKQLAEDQQRETTLQAYLNNMSDLLLKQNLAKSKPGDEVRQIARERTLTTLRRLDAKRNGTVLQFLQDTHLIGKQNAIVDLRDTQLKNVDLSGAFLYQADLSWDDLSDANLSGAFLWKVNLSHADLSRANLSKAYLWNTNLSHADLSRANLSHADLSRANLSHAFLGGANLPDADLSEVNLSEASLGDTNLRKANLSGADLSGAVLYHADLSGASLYGANLRVGNQFKITLIQTILKGAQYNTKEILQKDSHGKIYDKKPPTQWPQEFDPKAAGAIEENNPTFLARLCTFLQEEDRDVQRLPFLLMA